MSDEMSDRVSRLEGMAEGVRSAMATMRWTVGVAIAVAGTILVYAYGAIAANQAAIVENREAILENRHVIDRVEGKVDALTDLVREALKR